MNRDKIRALENLRWKNYAKLKAARKAAATRQQARWHRDDEKLNPELYKERREKSNARRRAVYAKTKLAPCQTTPPAQS